MAKYRIVHTDFWNDAKVMEEMTPEDKYFFLYILTNAQATQIGIYQITKKVAAFEMGYSIESISALFDRFLYQHKLINYNPETREIAIKHWGKYNFIRGGKPVLDCVKKELSEVKDHTLIQFVGQHIISDTIRPLYETYYDTSTIRTALGGQKEKEKEKEKEIKEEGEGSELTDNPHAFYQNNFGFPSPFVIQSITEWCKDVGDDLVLEAMKISLKNGIQKFSYVEKTLIDWANSNVSSLADVQKYQQQRKNNGTSSKPKTNCSAKSIIKELRGDKTNDS